MNNRELEVATLLRADAPLAALLPGGVYETGTLGEAGITDPVTTPGAYQSGRLRPCAVVRHYTPVPTFQLTSLRDRHASMSQTVEVWVYARQDTAVLMTALQRVYTLLQGRRLTDAWPTLWVGSLGPFPAPELAGAMTARSEYQVVSIRRPTPVV